MSSTLAEKLAAFDAALPLEAARTIPSSWYTDPEIGELERRAVFGDTWLVVGRSDQLPSPGSFITTEVAGEPILVVRDDDGILRGFYNVCRHRAARVAPEEQGKATRFRCRYHGWTYDLAGRLRGVPEFEGVVGFDREDNGLTPIHVAAWGPLMFAHLGSNPPLLEQFLAPMPARCAVLGLDRLRFHERRVYDLACNWKVFVDNYLDGGYHVNTIHPGLAGVLDYSHYRSEIEGNTCVQVSPMRPPGASDVASAAAVRKGDTAYYWWLFPNFMLNWYQGVMDTNLVLPLGPDRCRVVFDFYFEDAADGFKQQSTEVGHRIQLEDVGICEEVQRGLASCAFDTGRYSVKREAGVHHFHGLLAAKLRACCMNFMRIDVAPHPR